MTAKGAVVAKAMHGFVADFGPSAALAMESCVHCGRCAEACQFYVQTGDPRYTPIHKIAPFKQTYERGVGPFAFVYRLFGLVPKVTIEELIDWQDLIYDSCNMCGRCSLICPMSIDIADLVEKARHGMYEAGLAPQDFLGALAEKEHSTGSPFQLATPKVEDMLRELGEQQQVDIHVDEPRADIVVTVSSIDLKTYPSSIAAIAKVLKHMGASWTFRTDGFDADNVSLTAGDRAGQRLITRGIVQAAMAAGAKVLVMPECGHSFTEMRWEAANEFGQSLPFRVMQITELLAEALSDNRIRVNEAPHSATYHDACQLSRRGGASAAPRAILEALGVELHELEDAGDANWCCGGGGGVALIKRAQSLREKAFSIKQRQVDATGTAIVYTSCSGCRQTLDHGGKAVNWNMTVASLLELVAANLKD
ncbi:MAG: (Fe-S)-binding protein [Methylocystis sp.]